MGGQEEANGVFTAGDWDLVDDDGMFLEFDEASHFHRYRAQTLSLPWSEQLPWTDDYRIHCSNFESNARVTLSVRAAKDHLADLLEEMKIVARGPEAGLTNDQVANNQDVAT